jgi:hypothetical protein
MFTIMNKTYTNLCVRCGNERIVIKTSEEIYGSSVVITRETACSNVECQKVVDSDNQKQVARTAELKSKSEQRALQRRTTKASEKGEKNTKK